MRSGACAIVRPLGPTTPACRREGHPAHQAVNAGDATDRIAGLALARTLHA